MNQARRLFPSRFCFSIATGAKGCGQTPSRLSLFIQLNWGRGVVVNIHLCRRWDRGFESLRPRLFIIAWMEGNYRLVAAGCNPAALWGMVSSTLAPSTRGSVTLPKSNRSSRVPRGSVMLPRPPSGGILAYTFASRANAFRHEGSSPSSAITEFWILDCRLN